jgi:hypothetical protein
MRKRQGAYMHLDLSLGALGGVTTSKNMLLQPVPAVNPPTRWLPHMITLALFCLTVPCLTKVRRVSKFFSPPFFFFFL